MADLPDDVRAILAMLDAAYTPNNPAGPTPAELLARIEKMSANVDGIFEQIAEWLPSQPAKIEPLRVKGRRRVKTA